jgi:hypothetical protein
MSISEVTGQNTQKLVADITDAKGRKEVGAIIEVLGGETRKLIFSWSNTPGNNIDNYDLYFRKQAGVDSYPVTIKINTDRKILNSNPTFTLTDQGLYIYNTTLVRDLISKFSL